MPIKGLKRDERSVPRAGIIRLGYKTRYCQNQQCKYSLAYDEADTTKCPKCGGDMSKQTTAEASHFVLKDAPGVADALETDHPTELRIYLPFDDIDRNFPTYRTLFSSQAMTCQGDGQHILHAINPTTGQTTVKDGVCILPFSERMADNKQAAHKPGDKMPCPALGEPEIYAKCAGCSNRGILLVMLQAVPRMAYFQISTGSIVNLQELPQQMLNIQELIYELTGKRKLAGIPFILRRVSRSMSPVKKDKQGNPTGRVRVNKYVLQLEIEPEFMISLIRAQRRLVDPMAGYLASGQPVPKIDIVDSPSVINEPPQWEPPITEDADFEEIEPTEEAQPEPAPTEPAQPEQSTKPEPAQSNGNQTNGKLTRPMTPEQVKAAAEKRSARNANPASETQLDYAASSLSKAVDGDDKKRHSITKYLFGFESLKGATAGQCSFIIDWIGAKKENEYAPEPDALKEVEMILRQFLLDAGQVEMALPEAPAADGSEQPDPNDLDAWFPRQEEIDF